MYKTMLLGIHVRKKSNLTSNTRKNLQTAITEDVKLLKINSVQIFTHGPRSLVTNKIDYAKVKKACINVNLTVHSSYITTGIWNVNNNNVSKSISVRYIKHVVAQLEACKKIGAWGLVIHITPKIEPTFIAETMQILKPYAKKTNVKLILEMVASKANNNTYETPEKLNKLTTLIGPNQSWWGLCIDTAHIWAAGTGEVQTYMSMRDWLNRLIFKDKIILFHLNGSFSKQGSGKDKHAIAFSADDMIWRRIDPKKSGVRAIVEFAAIYKTPIICEINIGNKIAALDSLKRIRHSNSL